MAYLDTGKLADAERVFKWSMATDDKYALAYNGLGLISIKKQDQKTARGYFEKAVQLDPDLLEAQLNLGRIYKIMGANAQARACFEAFLAKASPAEYGPIIASLKARQNAVSFPSLRRRGGPLTRVLTKVRHTIGLSAPRLRLGCIL
jgi:Tfp pilus assembly protein PilF